MKMILFFLSICFSCEIFANEKLVIRHFKNLSAEVESYYGSPLLTEGITISVSQIQLVDNRGSEVDAIGERNRISLFEKSWLEFYRNGVDVRLLVLHELLRANTINDDDYRVSLPILNEVYASQNGPRRDETPFCLLHVSEYRGNLKTRKIKVDGYGPVENSNSFYFPNPNADKALENAYLNGEKECLRKGYEFFKVTRHGSFEQSSRVTNGFKRSHLKVRLNGECQKIVKRKKRRRELKRERCERAMKCLNMIEFYPDTDGKKSVNKTAKEVEEENC